MTHTGTAVSPARERPRFSNPHPSHPTQWVDNQPTLPDVENCLLKGRTCADTWKHQPACPFSLDGNTLPPLPLPCEASYVQVYVHVDRWCGCPPIGLGVKRWVQKNARGGQPGGLPNNRWGGRAGGGGGHPHPQRWLSRGGAHRRGSQPEPLLIYGSHRSSTSDVPIGFTLIVRTCSHQASKHSAAAVNKIRPVSTFIPPVYQRWC